MNPVKRYLLIFFAIYIGGGVIANVVLGPPGYSAIYKTAHSGEHDRYLDIVKSDAYKLWKQRPALNEIDAAKLGFVEKYESTDDFKAENRRQDLYNYFFESFTTIMVMILAVHFGKTPLLKFLDGQIAEVRGKLDTARQAREGAAQRKQAAQERVDGLAGEKERITQESDMQIAHERAHLEEMTEITLKQILKETEDRKREEELEAKQLLKKELVNQSIALLVKEYEAQVTPEAETAQIEQFIRDVEAHSA